MLSIRSAFPLVTRLPYRTLSKRATLCFDRVEWSKRGFSLKATKENNTKETNPGETIVILTTLFNIRQQASAPSKRGRSSQPSKPRRVKRGAESPWPEWYPENTKLTQLWFKRKLGITFIPESDKLLTQQVEEEVIKRNEKVMMVKGKRGGESGMYVKSAGADLIIKKSPAEAAEEKWSLKVNEKYYCMETEFISDMYRIYGKGPIEPQEDIDVVVMKYIEEHMKKDRKFRRLTTEDILDHFRGPSKIEVC